MEILAAEGLAQLGQVPKAAVARIKKKARFNVARIRKIESEVKHEIIAFLSCVAESVGDDARFLHVGMTSSDVMDTALAIQFKEASAILLQDVKDLMKVLRRQAFKYKWTVMIGRTHGVHAEPITFGLKLALWYQEMVRNLARLQRAVDEICVGEISGAVGTFAQISPKVEAYVCRKAGLKPALISNQIIQRDRHAYFFATLAVIASSLEKFAVEVRHLQRTEVQEAEEPFTEGQKGSSAMPHKRNPILSENVSGLARLMRGYAMRISSPATISPCYYGIDTPTRSELIASSNSVEEIRGFIEADTLAYLSREGMYTYFNGESRGFCDACFSGNYPVHFEDEGHTRQLHLFEAVAR